MKNRILLIVIILLPLCGCILSTENYNVTTTTQLIVGTPIEPSSERISLQINSIDYENSGGNTLFYVDVEAKISDKRSSINLGNTKIFVNGKEYVFGGIGDCIDEIETKNYFHILDHNLSMLHDGDKIQICLKGGISDKKATISIAPRVGEITKKEIVIDEKRSEIQYGFDYSGFKKIKPIVEEFSISENSLNLTFANDVGTKIEIRRATLLENGLKICETVLNDIEVSPRNTFDIRIPNCTIQNRGKLNLEVQIDFLVTIGSIKTEHTETGGITRQTQEMPIENTPYNNVNSEGKKHVFIYFHFKPNNEEIEELSKKGVSKLGYVAQDKWVVKVNVDDIKEIQQIEIVKKVEGITHSDKLSPSVKDGIDSWSKDENGNPIIELFIFKDEDFKNEKEKISQYGSIRGSSDISRTIVLITTETNIKKILDIDSVKYVTELNPPATTDQIQSEGGEYL